MMVFPPNVYIASQINQPNLNRWLYVCMFVTDKEDTIHQNSIQACNWLRKDQARV